MRRYALAFVIIMAAIGTVIVAGRFLRARARCGSHVAATLGSDFRDSDLDTLIGPRIEVYEIVYGPRIRVEGLARNVAKEGSQVVSQGGVDINVAIEHGWPWEINGRNVVVEGCLNRTYVPREMSYPSKPGGNLRAVRVGFIYRLTRVTYEVRSGTQDAADQR